MPTATKKTKDVLTHITALKELNAATRRYLRKEHRGFIHQLAHEMQRHPSQLYRMYRQEAWSKSAIVEAAIIRRVNELLAMRQQQQQEQHPPPAAPTPEHSDDATAPAQAAA